MPYPPPHPSPPADDDALVPPVRWPLLLVALLVAAVVVSADAFRPTRPDARAAPFLLAAADDPAVASMAPPAPPPAPPATPTPAAPAEAPAPVATPAASHLAGSIAEVCAAVRAAVPLAPPPGWRLECRDARPRLMGEMDLATRMIIVYLRPHWTLATAARVYAHELGHAYDFDVLTHGDRAEWMAARGLTGPWGARCHAGPCDDTLTPTGDWAEAFGEWLVPGTGMWSGGLAPPPGPGQIDLLAQLLARRGVGP